MKVYQAYKRAIEKPRGRGTVGSWHGRHTEELTRVSDTNEHPRAILGMLEALARYADAHAARYQSPIGADGVLGDSGWLPALRGVRALLNGETGDLDCGTVDAAIVEMARAAEFSAEEIDSL